jgi:uncharacterized protein (TIGR00251 family)
VIEIQQRGNAVVFAVRVQPRAGRDKVAGEWEGSLKIRLQAPPVEDRAKEALCRFLAEVLKIPASAVRILSGERSRSKRVEVRGVTPAQVHQLLIHDA